MEKAIVKFLFFIYSHFWYFYRAHLAPYMSSDKSESAISHFQTIFATWNQKRGKPEKRADTESFPPKANHNHPDPTTKTPGTTHRRHRYRSAKNDPAPPRSRIKISLSRTTITAGGNQDNPKITPMKIWQHHEITRYKNKNLPEITGYRHLGTYFA